MNDRSGSDRGRRWIRVAIVILIGGALLALAAHEFYSIYAAGRMAQSAADGAVLAGSMELARVLEETSRGEGQIEAEMRKFAARNGLPGSDKVVGYYLDAEYSRLGLVGSGLSPDVSGLEAVVTTRADTFLIRLLGLRGYPIQRAAVLCFEVRYPEGGGTSIIFAPLRD